MTKEGKGVNFKQFVNKDGYAKGGVKVDIASQHLHLDPRSETSFRGKSNLAVGNTNPVRKGKAARKQKDVTWV